MQKTPEELRRAFWQEDFLNGSVIRKQYDTIKRVLRENDLEWVEEQYKAIKLHAIKNTEYYKDFDADDPFPVMDKLLLDKHREACTARTGYNEPLHVTSTSGSTGTPFSVIQDYDKRKRTIADLKVFGEMCDYPSHERMVFFRIINRYLNRTAEQEDRENIYYVDSSDLSDVRLKEMHRILIDKKPRTVFSYSSTLVELAKYLMSIEADPSDMRLTSVLCGGEGITEENRRMLEQAFGCHVYRRYSNMEMGILGQDEGDGGSYRLNWGSYYFESLMVDRDEPADAGEVGRIVVTDLFNYAFPMIRYDTGDLGVLDLPAGDGFPQMLEIMGRKSDCVYAVTGELISPRVFGVAMWGATGVHQWQFVQETEDEYQIRLNCEKHIDYSYVIERFRNILGESARINVTFVEEIPVTASNKRRAIICKLKRKLKA